MPTFQRSQAIVLMLAAIAVIAATLFLLGQGPSGLGSAAWTLASDGSLTMLWLIAALGAGWWARPLLARTTLGEFDQELLQWAIGTVTLLWLDAVLGTLGLLSQPVVTWSLTLLLGIGGVLRIRLWKAQFEADRFATWVMAAAVVPLAVLLLAALSTPGWLWATEFGGYDALSYHLQLPREWTYLGRINETPHNAYGYLPNGVEAAFMHLGILRGSPWHAAISCQLLSAAWAVLAAIITARVANHLLPEDTRESQRSVVAALGGVLVLATPWVIVVGSLAYDETAVLVCLAAALLLLLGMPEIKPRIGLLLGLLAGGACLAKLSSGPLVVAPLAVAGLVMVRPRDWPFVALAATGAGVLIMAPWLVRNWMWTGNPTFPFLPGILGPGPWSEAQHAIWQAGHGGNLDGGVLAAFFNEFLREGIGPAPEPGVEPWKAQWSIMPWLALGGFIALFSTKRSSRRNRSLIAMTVLTVCTILAWMLFTHAKARFLLPMAIPMSAVIATAAGVLFSSAPSRFVLLPVAWVLALVPLGIYLGERNGQPTWGVSKTSFFRGDYEQALIGIAPNEQARMELLSSASPNFILNHLLPPESRILLLGEASPFHLDMNKQVGDRIVYHTVWTRGPLERAIAESDAPSEWVAELQSRGYTHVFLRPGMLQRWRDSGWLAEELSVHHIKALVENLQPIHAFGQDAILLAVPGDPAKAEG
ncbi:MAG: hypothetical protein MK085_01775 [Phycisphaerales bacterium]|nr:hypothetical protein [Phycisphaerales bacterium]